MRQRRSTVPLDNQPSDAEILSALLREDLAYFIHKSFNTVTPGTKFLPNWHIEHIAWQLMRVFRGETKRLMILLPPRSLKSVSTSVAFPAWVLGHDPTAKIVCVSYAEGLARKHALDCRSVVQADWYKKIFPKSRIDPSKNTELEFMTTRRGYRLSTSVGGTLTGRGGNLIIIDDPLKPDEAISDSRREAVNQWYANTLVSRLNSKVEDAIILVMQRLHADDLAGHLLESEDWTVATIPAIAEEECQYELGANRVYVRKSGEVIDPRREPKHILDAIKTQINSQAFNAQYQQSPVPQGGAMIKWEWFRRFKLQPAWREYERFVHSWDTATKAGELNDYSVGTVWLMHKNEIYLLDIIRERHEYPDLKRRIIEVANTHRYKANDILIEDAVSGSSLIQDLRDTSSLHPIAIKVEKNKVMRLWGVTASIESGQVFIPEEAPWLDDFQTEVMRFPQVRHDDQVDSMTQMLHWWRDRKRRVFGVSPLLGF
jgi:predicted phage terminase large subunit-like protein